MAYEFRFKGPASTDASQLLGAVERTVQGHLIRVEGGAGPDANSINSNGSQSEGSSHEALEITIVKCPPVIIGHKPACYNALIGESPYVIIGHKPLIVGAAVLFVLALVIGILIGRAVRGRSQASI